MAVVRKPVVVATGSSGLIGSRVLARLRDDYELVGFDVVEPEQEPAGVHHVTVDISDDDSVRDGLAQVRERFGDRLASVLHFAAFYDFSGGPNEKYRTITIEGTRRLIDGLQPFTVEQFVFSSTMLVHQATQPGKPITADSPFDADWPYPQSKETTEQLLREKHGDIPLVLLRLAGVYTDEGNSIPITNQIHRIHQKAFTSHFFPGDQSHGQSFLHVDDVASLYAKVVHRRAELPDEVAMVIGESEVMSYGELQNAIARALWDTDWKTFWVPPFLAKLGAWLMEKVPGTPDPFIKPWMIDIADDHYELDISRARELLDWAPDHRLRETIPKMIEALRADPEGWYEQHGLNK